MTEGDLMAQAERERPSGYGRRVCPVSMAHCCRHECDYDGCAYVLARPWPPPPDVHDVTVPAVLDVTPTLGEAIDGLYFDDDRGSKGHD